MARFLYLEVDVVCIIILILFTRIIINNERKQYDEKLFSMMSVSLVAVLTLDALWSCIDGISVPFLSNINLFICSLFFVVGNLTCYFWFLYCNFKSAPAVSKVKNHEILYFVPMGLLLFFHILNFKYGFIFYIDENNIYHRGSLHLLQSVIPNLYLAASILLTFFRGLKAKNSDTEKSCFLLSGATLLPIIGGTLQFVLPGYPLLWVSAAISLIFIFINIQNSQVSLDGLTGIYNRRMLNRYIDMKLSDKHRIGKTYLILLDIDGFKQINDTFGHIYGDQALIRVSSILKYVCVKNSDFVARYGGDEFAIVCERADRFLLNQLSDEINYEMQIFNTKGKFEFELCVSMGAADFDDAENQDDLIAAADENLYEIKKSKKAI